MIKDLNVYTLYELVILSVVVAFFLTIGFDMLYKKGFRETVFLVRLCIWVTAIVGLFYENYTYVFMCLIYGAVVNFIHEINFIYKKLINKEDKK